MSKKETILSTRTDQVLYEDSFPSFAACVEQAIADNVNLAGADFRNRNFSNACLDDGLFERADFSGANLTGANLSEARLNNAFFTNADLYNTCLAYSELKNCDFSGSSFGATDIAGTDIGGARFSTLSCFSLDYSSARAMPGCRFINDRREDFFFSNPPVVIRGVGPRLLVFGENNWMNGTEILPYPEHFRKPLFVKKTVKSQVESVKPRVEFFVDKAVFMYYIISLLD